MPAIELRRDTPGLLRLFTTVTAAVAAVLLVALTLVMISVRDQVRVIGREAAPQAATAADLYFALSDLDAQVTRILLAGDSDESASSRIDALGLYRDRGYQADRDLQKSTADSAVTLRLMDGLAVYRQRVGQALAASAASDRIGYWTQATNLLHQRLLPDAQQLRRQSQQSLDDAYARKSATETTGIAVAVLLGGSLVALLIFLQVWLARRFRRFWNPALLAATALSLLLLISATVVLQLQSRQLTEGRDTGLGPYLALSEMRALGYDAAADTGRYLVSANLSFYRDDFTAKSACLTGDPSCRRASGAAVSASGVSPSGASAAGSDAASARGGLAPLAGSVAADRWIAYQAVHQRIVTLADNGRTDEAVRLLTGIRRGDAAFDFAYFDASVATVTETRRQDFDRALRAAETTLTGWSWLPALFLLLVLLLLPLSVRPRLAEYR
ncbi:hypothetical protein [Actinoplanes sichuanensis]|uniref:DUF4239 domain-containing protein n=1 Tax=Actinoplanes sichuanensis TaxID=512349 RepID=A0ABW4AIC6_9ACTN|nr:hypothetical protein [Actinoplanes sichuanensis]